MNKQFKHQGGWVASFLIVGILLTLAVLGGLYYIKSNQKQLAKNDGDTTSQTTTVEPSKDNENNSDEKGETVDTNTQNSAANNQESTNSQSQSSTSSTGSTAKLPATGPEDTLQNAFILALVAFSVATYVRSRELSR